MRCFLCLFPVLEREIKNRQDSGRTGARPAVLSIARRVVPVLRLSSASSGAVAIEVVAII